jgi:hypothetical protein
MSLFVVERRLPKIAEQQLAVLLGALSGAAGRFRAPPGAHCARAGWQAAQASGGRG